MLGANDGLVSNLSLVMGVAGAELAERHDPRDRASRACSPARCSMAMGEWISVQSSRELYAHQIEVERLEIATMPELETRGARADLPRQGRARPPRPARWPSGSWATRTTALDAMAREELGIDPDELGGSAVVAAVASFVPFTLGAAVPGAPVRLPLRHRRDGDERRRERRRPLRPRRRDHAAHPPRRRPLRQRASSLIGLAAAAVTFAIGRLVGVEIS